MTATLEEHEERRRPKSFARAIILGLEGIDETKRVEWPCDKYAKDPVGFAREVLGVQPWSRQIEILEAVRDFKRVSVSSGHKIGKSNCIAILALWFFCSFYRARVVLTSTTSRQVDSILWREIRMLHASALIPIGGDIKVLARSGLRSDDFREVVGFTAREAEAVAGVSGPNLLYLPDEASGIDDKIFMAIEGNRAGGARLAMFSNPTRTEGEHYEAHEGSKREFYRTITVSSEETPNAVSGTDVIPGLATREWIEEKRKEWGEDSALFMIRVKGKHALREDGKILSVHDIAQAELRWPDTKAVGRLHIGVDPSGPSGGGDEGAFACRRGLKITRLHAKRGLDEEAYLAEVLGLCTVESCAEDEEKPLVTVDRDGHVGAKVYAVLLAYVLAHEKTNDAAFELIGVRSSERAKRAPLEYFLIRDELYMVFAAWIKEGGSIPEDTKLAKDLHAPSWEHDVLNRARATSKKDLIKILGRSPDRGDACILSVWTPSDYESTAQAVLQQQARVNRAERRERVPVLDPYSGLDPWSGRNR